MTGRTRPPQPAETRVGRACAGREAKCPYLLLLRRHCPLPGLLRKPPPKPCKAAADEPGVPTDDEPHLTGASAKSMSLDLKLDYQFDSPPASHDGAVGQSSARALHDEDGNGLPPRSHRGGSKTASDPVQMPYPTALPQHTRSTSDGTLRVNTCFWCASPTHARPDSQILMYNHVAAFLSNVLHLASIDATSRWFAR